MIRVSRDDRRPSDTGRSAVANGPRRSLTALAALTVVLVGISALASASALALDQRGHVFSFAFGAQGTGPGEFVHPSGVAVNDRTGEVYVADREGGRVEEFKPVYDERHELSREEYVGALAVAHPSAIAIDNCSTASGPCSASEDPSLGDIYVAGKSGAGVVKFSEAGAELGTLKRYRQADAKKEAKLGQIEGLAVDTHGSLLVYQEPPAVIASFNDAAPLNAPTGSLAVAVAEPAPGLAVDASGAFFVGHRASQQEDAATEGELVREISEEYEELHIGVPLRLIAPVQGTTGDPTAPGLDYEDTTAVAVDPAAGGGDEADDVYLDNITGTGSERTTSVAAFAPESEGSQDQQVGAPRGKLIQRFSAPGLTEGDGVAVDAADGDVYVSDGASDRVYVFTLESAGNAGVGSLEAQQRGPGAIKLSASVEPNGAPASPYQFEYGTGACSAVPSTCTRTAPTEIAGGFGEREASTELQDLAPGAYHYRLVSEDGSVESAEQTFTIVEALDALPDGRRWEMVSPAEKDGAQPEAITKEGGVIQTSESGDAISYIATGPMPADGDAEGSRSPEWNQILSVRGEQGGWTSRDLTTANSAGVGYLTDEPPEYRLFSSDLALSIVEPIAVAASEPGEPSLSTPPLSPPVEAGEPQENTVYLRDDRPLEPEVSPSVDCKNSPASARCDYERAMKAGEELDNAGFLALVTRANAPEHAEFDAGGYLNVEFVNATADLSHVVLDLRKTDPGLYEWSGGEDRLEPVSVLPAPSNSLASEPALGGQTGTETDSSHAISDDGSLVFWSAPAGTDRAHLYVRDTETQTTLQLDQVQEGAVGEGPHDESPAEAVFQTASVDGSKVFFTDAERLTPDSDAVKGAPNLYVAELSDAAGPLSATLKDLTPGEGADVLARGEDALQGGQVIGASEDGSYVYFVANGALAPGATRGTCARGAPFRAEAATCDLYVRHYDGSEWTATKLIAALSSEDRPDWGKTSPNLSGLTSRVSPNGQYLAFMSDRSLTGYDNEDVTGDGHMDEEVYVYNAVSERLVCASCNPTGARPAGFHDVGTPSSEGVAPLVDRHLIWAEGNGQREYETDHWLAGSVPGWTALSNHTSIYQSPYLSNSGRLFFNSPDHLVPAATGDKEKVYEYEPQGVGTCGSGGGCVALISAGSSPAGTEEHESAFLDASANGNDVFFLTAEKLVPQDSDSNFDVYDAHVCESSAPCAEATSGMDECAEMPTLSSCRGEASSLPAFSTPASANATISGNPLQTVLPFRNEAKPPPPTRAQLLAQALKACHRDRSKSKRLACERTARKRYGPTLASALKACAKDRRRREERVACEKAARKLYGPAKHALGKKA